MASIGNYERERERERERHTRNLKKKFGQWRWLNF